MSERVLVELCAGTASVSLRALAGRPVQPLTGYMGSKRRWASTLAELLGFGREPPDRVVLVDAGPWGDVWTRLRDPVIRRLVAHMFDLWAEEDPHALWARLVTEPPPAEGPVFRIAQFLWLQARSAGTIPIWWSTERSRWESPTGSRTETAYERGGRELTEQGRNLDGPAYEAGSRKLGKRGKPNHPGSRGVQRPATIARRIEALDRLPWDRVDVVHGDLRAVEPMGGGLRAL